MRKKKQKKQEETARALEENLGVPKLLKPHMPHIEMEGNREVILDGCEGVIEYNEDSIKLKAGTLLLTFTGEGLTVKSYANTEAIIEGTLVSVSFEN